MSPSDIYSEMFFCTWYNGQNSQTKLFHSLWPFLLKMFLIGDFFTCLIVLRFVIKNSSALGIHVVKMEFDVRFGVKVLAVSGWGDRGGANNSSE